MTRIKLTALAVTLTALTSVAAANSNHSKVDYRIKPHPEMTLRAKVRSHLATQRQIQVSRLAAYSAKGIFPRNTVATGLLNVFVDDAGNLCAAANLIALSGNRALVAKTAKRDNFIRLVNVKKGALLDWMLMSGLTVEEIDRIQEPYMGMPMEPEPSVIAAETRRLQLHFNRVLAELSRNTEASLDAATDRVMKRLDLVAKITR